ncbi:MAG: hypothetical protein DSY76_08030 [Bacteroidetes bacterium]|nr:MAG: hypothetical protein DSY76_08030 [Bacteroidota bacterium]
MIDEVFLGFIVIFVILAWYFAIRKLVCHYKILKNSNYGILAKFFVLGIPFLFILPANTVNESNNDMFKKGKRYYILFLCAFAFTYLTFFIWMSLMN